MNIKVDRKVIEAALEALDYVMRHGPAVQKAKDILQNVLEQPERKPLTDMDIADIYKKWDATQGVSMADFARAIEAAHGIKE